MIGDYTIEVYGDKRAIRVATYEWLDFNEYPKWEDFIYDDQRQGDKTVYDILSKHSSEVQSLVDWLSAEFYVEFY